jgi:hypothetical protein
MEPQSVDHVECKQDDSEHVPQALGALGIP